MEMFNQWLQQIQTTQSGDPGRALYNNTGTVCTILMWLAILLYTYRLRLNPIKTILIGYLTNLFLGYAQHLATWYRRDFVWDNYFGTSNIGYAFILLPIFCWLCDKVFNLSRGTSGELAAISTMAWHFVGRSGCTFTGCCYGIDCSWGIYSHYAQNNSTGGLTFPVCWLESLFSLGILIFLVVRMLRRGYLPEESNSRLRLVNWYYSKRRQLDDGKALPYLLVSYGVMRFFTEFLRHHEADEILFGFLPTLSILALIMALVGGAMLYYLHQKQKKAELASKESAFPTLKGQRK